VGGWVVGRYGVNCHVLLPATNSWDILLRKLTGQQNFHFWHDKRIPTASASETWAFKLPSLMHLTSQCSTLWITFLPIPLYLLLLLSLLLLYLLHVSEVPLSNPDLHTDYTN
jgi:hypothetical protein